MYNNRFYPYTAIILKILWVVDKYTYILNTQRTIALYIKEKAKQINYKQSTFLLIQI